MKTKSFLFTLITGIIFNTYAFAGVSENNSLYNETSDLDLMYSQEIDFTAEDTLKSVDQNANEKETETASNQFDNSEKFAVTVVVFIAGTVGTAVAVVYCSVRSTFRRVNNLKYDRTSGWH